MLQTLKKFNIKDIASLVNINRLYFDRAKNPSVYERPINEFFNVTKLVHDSGWLDCSLSDIRGAYTRDIGLYLPQKATFSYSRQFSINEPSLYRIKPKILTKTNPTQEIVGSGKYTYSSLVEISFSKYIWQGVTSITGSQDSHAGVAYYDDEGGFHYTALPDKDTQSPSAYPPPQTAYTTVGQYENIQIFVGSTLNYQLSDDGTQVLAGGELVSLSSLLGTLAGYYGDISYTAYRSTTINFVPDVAYYIPFNLNESYSFPMGTSDDQDDHSTEEYPDQYYMIYDTVTFNDIVNDYGYEKAVNHVVGLVPDATFTADGVTPAKAYQEYEEEVIQSSNNYFEIRKLGDSLFEYKINGQFLLNSKSTTETDDSDPEFPTYKPMAEDMQVRILFYLEPLVYVTNVKRISI